MRIQFCHNCTEDFVAEFEVASEPTKSQCEAIEDEIYKTMGEWEEEHDGDFEDFDFWDCCYNALNKYVPIVANPVVKTFYI
jgi:hypothetical protein